MTERPELPNAAKDEVTTRIQAAQHLVIEKMKNVIFTNIYKLLIYFWNFKKIPKKWNCQQQQK